MTVKELMKILKRHDKAATVLVDGYEYGVCDLGEDGIMACRYSRDVNTDENAGEHEINQTTGSYVGVLLSRGW